MIDRISAEMRRPISRSKKPIGLRPEILTDTAPEDLQGGATRLLARSEHLPDAKMIRLSAIDISDPLPSEVFMSPRRTPVGNSAPAATEPCTQDGKRLPRILVVEDNVDGRFLLEEFLGVNGFDVSVVKSGDEAIALWDGGIAYDLVVLDLALPRKSGADVLAHLRTTPHGKSVPVVVVTAFPQAAPPGVTAVLQKPPSLDKLLQVVIVALQERARASV